MTVDRFGWKIQSDQTLVNVFFDDIYRYFTSVTFDFALCALFTLQLMTFKFIQSKDTVAPNILVLAGDLESLVKDIH